MGVLSAFRRPNPSLKRKLFGHMLLLTILLLLSLLTMLYMLGQFTSIEQRTYESLDIQMDIYEERVSSHFDKLAAAAVLLSEDMTDLVEEELSRQDMVFSQLTNSEDAICQIQESMLLSLKQKLFQEDCSGIFVLLDATVNDRVDNAALSRTGIYLQVNGYEKSNQNILLYRGLSEVGKSNDIMPHRKWRLEFRTDLLPHYDQLKTLAQQPLEKSFLFSDLQTLPGTSDKVLLIMIPIVGSDSTFYGVCGFEVSASYFMTYHAQPSKIDHLTCLLVPGSGSILDTDAALSSGVSKGYYRMPSGKLNISGNTLLTFTGDVVSYVGLTRSAKLSTNNPNFTLATMILKTDYDDTVHASFLKNMILCMLLAFITIAFCILFSRRFLTPLLHDLEQVKQSDQGEISSQIPEINDLFAFLAEKDRNHEDTLSRLRSEKQLIQNERDQLRFEYEKTQQKIESAQAEISRLAYSRKQEIDPDDYRNFLAGIKTLTPSETKIFQYYLEGKTVKEITVIAAIKESTLRYHNQNIYTKLGVNSLKQLLRYATLMEQGDKEIP